VTAARRRLRAPATDERALVSTIAITTLRATRAGRVAAALAVAVLTLAACNDRPAGADAPEDAAVDAFCKVIGGLDVSDPEQLIDDLVDTGTPEGIPDDARAGFEVMIDQARADEISDADQDKVSAFVGYVTTTCGAFPADTPTE
jgi:hypothetical protein